MSSPQAAEGDLGSESLVSRAVRRRSGDRHATAEEEVRRILDVGLELMRVDPAGNPRIADIVRRAKVSNDAFYRAFRGKDELMAAIVDDGARRLLAYTRHQCEKHDDPVERIRACVLAVFQQVADPEVAATTRAVLRHSPRVPSSAGGAELRQRIAELLAEPLAASGSRDPQRDALVASCSMFAVMEHFLWTERAPSESDIGHLIAWIMP